MNLIRRITSVLALSTAFVMGLPVSSAQAQGTAFTYQGHLQAASAEASGIYDFKFRLYDAPTGGAQIGSELAVSGITINDGRFSLSLDFGEAYDGTPRWLEIEVANAGAGAYTLLSPRQAITPAPQAIYASKAGEATTATVALSTDTADSALNGVPTGFSILGDSQTAPAGFTWSGRKILIESDSWETRASKPSYMNNATATSINNKFYIFSKDQTAVYDPETNLWDETLVPVGNQIGPTRYVANAVEGNIYLIGLAGDIFRVCSMIMYDVDNDSWELKAEALHTADRSGPACVLNGKIYLFGYAPGTGFVIQAYDVADDSWSSTTMPVEEYFDAVVPVDGKIYAFAYNAAYMYDPTADAESAWTPISPIPTPRNAICAVNIKGKIHCLGGQNGATYYDLNEIYDPVTDTWTTGQPTLAMRAGGAVAAIDNHIYVTVGIYNNGTAYELLTSTECYTPEISSYIHIKD